jgi:hypothetical protein
VRFAPRLKFSQGSGGRKWRSRIQCEIAIASHSMTMSLNDFIKEDRKVQELEANAASQKFLNLSAISGAPSVRKSP